MPSSQPDAIALLKEDHRKVEDLFEKFEAASGDKKKVPLVQKICTELVIHTMIEEEIFYPALRGKIEDDTLDEAYVEHDGAKMLIAELARATPDAPFYDAKVKVLSEEIKHHVKEEERPSTGMFAQARATGADMAALGAHMAARKEELKAQFKANGLPTPTTRSMQGAPVERGEPLEVAA